MLWKLLIVALAAAVLYKLFTNEKNQKNKKDDKLREKKIAKGDLIKDPICGNYVDAEGSISVKDGNKTFRFCSYECREKFLQQIEDTGRAIPGRNEDEDDK